MQNYMKSEWYRVVRSHGLYLLTGVLCALVLIMNVLLYTMSSSEPGFPYSTIWFSLSNLTAYIPYLFFGAGLIVTLLFADDKKNGICKNALAQGISRTQLFFGKIVICTLSGLICLAVILAAYILSAVLLLSGPWLEPVQYLLECVVAALPSTLAVVVLAVAGFTIFNNTTATIVFWFGIVFIIPMILAQIALGIEAVAVVTSWIPTIIFGNEVIINMSGARYFPWDTSFGLMKCLVAGFGSLLVFTGFGVWRARKLEL